MDTKPNLGSLQTELESAVAELRRAEKEESMAAQRVCTWRNNVTDLQKKISAAIDLLQKEAPRATSWADQREVRHPA